MFRIQRPIKFKDTYISSYKYRHYIQGTFPKTANYKLRGLNICISIEKGRRATMWHTHEDRCS